MEKLTKEINKVEYGNRAFGGYAIGFAVAMVYSLIGEILCYALRSEHSMEEHKEFLDKYEFEFDKLLNRRKKLLKEKEEIRKKYGVHSDDIIIPELEEIDVETTKKR